jgi:membrane-associated protease RseP (regulator of RpoE activity)
VNELVGIKLLNLDPKDHPVIVEVGPGSAAEQAGLKPDDQVISFAGVPVVGQKQLIGLIRKRPGLASEIQVQRAMRYCESPFFYHRRQTREVVIGDPARGGVIIGGDHPVVKQSMLTCDTMDTAECVKQTLELVAVGCQLVRITAPTVKDAANLQNIVAELRAAAASCRLWPTSISSPKPRWKR